MEKGATELVWADSVQSCVLRARGGEGDQEEKNGKEEGERGSMVLILCLRQCKIYMAGSGSSGEGATLGL